jgi:hypothetical protein
MTIDYNKKPIFGERGMASNASSRYSTVLLLLLKELSDLFMIPHNIVGMDWSLFLRLDPPPPANSSFW